MISNQDAKTFSDLSEISCDNTYHIDGIGDVNFPSGVYRVETAAKVSIPPSSPEEFPSVLQAAQIATTAIKSANGSTAADSIISKLSFSLNPVINPNDISLPVSVIRSSDFFQDRLSVIPNLASFNQSIEFESPSAVLDFIKNKPLHSGLSTQAAISETTSLTLEQIKNTLISNGVTSSEILSKGSVQDIVNAVRLSGILVMSPFDSISPLASMIDEAESFLKFSGDKAAAEVYSCPVGDVVPSNFSSAEADSVASQCCEPTEETTQTLSIPAVQNPDSATLDQINEFIGIVNQASKDMTACAQQRASAELYISKIRKIKEDLYTLSYYFSERYKAMIEYGALLSLESTLAGIFSDDRSLISNIQKKAEQTFGKATVSQITGSNGSLVSDTSSIADIQHAYNQLYSLSSSKTKIPGVTATKKKMYLASIQSYANDFQKNAATIATLQENIKIMQAGVVNMSSLDSSTLTLATFSSSFSVSSFLSREILYPSLNDKTTQYSNQSGLLSDNSYFLLLNEDSSIFNEIEALFELNLSAKSMNDFLHKTSSPPKKIDKIAKNPMGTLYAEFFNEYNSYNRVDFLFSYQEQGYLKPKPPVTTLSSPDGQKFITENQIDQDAASKFLTNYSDLESARVLQKLSDVKTKHADFFASVQLQAKKEANIVYKLESASYLLGLPAAAAKISTYRDSITQENSTMSKFIEQLDNKVDSLMASSAKALQCLSDQETALQNLAPSSPAQQVSVAPGSDPFGKNPADPMNPGITKKCYWDEYTKCLQTVSFMPVPDVQQLNKRLFRYYPVGLRIPVPTPPGVLPTLAMGIPDSNISIPFPILWKNILNLSTPAGTFVLWITYCAPYSVAPYLMYFDEDLNFVFLTTPRGLVDIPAPSMKWSNSSIINKSLIDRLPGLKIPFSSLPQLDNSTDNRNADNVLGGLQELRNRIKAAIDALNSTEITLTAKRIENRSILKKYRDILKSTLDIQSGEINVPALVNFLGEIKVMMRDDIEQMITFEPFSIPKTQKKLVEAITPLEDFQDQLSRIKSLSSIGVNVSTKTIDVGKILRQECSKLLDNKLGREIAAELQANLNRSDASSHSLGIFGGSQLSSNRSAVILHSLQSLLGHAVSNMTPKSLGFTEAIIDIGVSQAPFPCKSNFMINPMPPWIILVLAALKQAVSLVLNPEVQANFVKDMNLTINLQEPSLPSARDILYQAIFSGVKSVMDAIHLDIPGWPNGIKYIDAATMMSQALQELENSIWKIKFRLSFGGIPAIEITPEIVKDIALPLVDAAVDIVFAEIINSLKIIEQNKSATINNIGQVLLTIRAVFGNDIWDLNEQDLKIAAVGFAKNALQTVDNTVTAILKPVDLAIKIEKSIFKSLAPNSLQLGSSPYEPCVDIGHEVSTALFKYFTLRYASGDLVAPPYIAVLLACSTGIPGWTAMTAVNPFKALERIPSYEGLSLKNVPFVIFLDMIATTAQRVGGIGSDYVIPYLSPEN